MKITLCALSMMLAAGAASAQTYQWEWTGQSGHSDAGGEIEHVLARFNTITNQTLWRLTFADQITDGFTLAVSPGPNPKGHGGELALLYFDATSLNDPRITVYNYNGHNSMTSFKDGSPVAGNQTPDLIHSTFDAELVTSQTWSFDRQDGRRVLGFKMDASAINGHSPMYPGNSPWTGMAFGEELGIWMHPFTNLTATYSDDGALLSWGGEHGWLDGNGFNTRQVPAPGAAGLALLGGALAARRRRA